MARGRNRVRVTIEGENQLSPAVRTAQKDVTGLTGGLKGLTGGLTTAAGAMLPLSLGAAGIGAGFTQAFGASKQLNASMAEVASIAPDLAADLGTATDQVRDLSEETGIASDQISSGLYQAVSAGVPPDNVFDFLRTAAEASIGGVTDLTTAVDGISSATNAWGTENLSAETAADQMFTAVKNGKTNFEELSRSIATVAPIASNTGVSFGEVTAALATLTASGTTTRESATQVRAAIQALVRPSGELAAVFQAAGHASGEAAVKAVGFAGAADIVREATGGSVGQMTQLLGSVEAVQAVLGVTGDKASVMAKNFNDAATSAGAAGAAFQEVASSDAHDLDVSLNKIGSAAERLASQALPAVADFAGGMSDVLDGIDDVRTGEAGIIEQSLDDGFLGWMFEAIKRRAEYKASLQEMGDAAVDAVDRADTRAKNAERALKELHGWLDLLPPAAKTGFAALTQETRIAFLQARDLNTELDIAGNTDIEPVVSTTQIDNALGKVRELRRLLSEDDILASENRGADLAGKFASYERNLMGRPGAGDAWGTGVRRRRAGGGYTAPSYVANPFGGRGDQLVPTEMLNTWETVYETADKVDEVTSSIGGNLAGAADEQDRIAALWEPWQMAYDDVNAAQEALNALKADEEAATERVAAAQERVLDITREVSDQVNDIVHTSAVYAANIGLAQGGANTQAHRQRVLGEARERFDLQGVDLYQENLDPEVAERAREAMAWVNEKMREYTSMTALANAEQQNIVDLAKAQAEVVKVSNQERLDTAGELVTAEQDALTAVTSQVEQATLVKDEKQATLDLVTSAVELARIGEETTLVNLQTRYQKLEEIRLKEEAIHSLMTRPVTRTVNIIEKVTRLADDNRRAWQRDAGANGRQSIFDPDA